MSLTGYISILVSAGLILSAVGSAQEGVIDCGTMRVNRSDIKLISTELKHEVDCIRTGDFIEGMLVT